MNISEIFKLMPDATETWGDFVSQPEYAVKIALAILIVTVVLKIIKFSFKLIILACIAIVIAGYAPAVSEYFSAVGQ